MYLAIDFSMKLLIIGLPETKYGDATHGFSEAGQSNLLLKYYGAYFVDM